MKNILLGLLPTSFSDFASPCFWFSHVQSSLLETTHKHTWHVFTFVAMNIFPTFSFRLHMVDNMFEILTVHLSDGHGSAMAQARNRAIAP